MKGTSPHGEKQDIGLSPQEKLKFASRVLFFIWITVVAAGSALYIHDPSKITQIWDFVRISLYGIVMMIIGHFFRKFEF